MPKHIFLIVYLFVMAIMFSLVPLEASAAGASGTLDINKKKFKLVHGYVDVGNPDEPVIVLSDKPLPSDQIPFLSADYVTKKKVHAVVFGIISKDKKLSPMRWVYFGGDADIPVTVFPDDRISLELKRSDDAIVEGNIKTTQPVKLSDLTYSFNADFKLSVKEAREKAMVPKKVSFTGDDSAPVKAYKEYYRSIMEGNAENLKKYLVTKNLKEFESFDSKEREMALELMKMRPEKIKIEKPIITGDEATFKVEGKEGSDLSTGSIKMLLEDGKWKVLEDKWKTISK